MSDDMNLKENLDHLGSCRHHFLDYHQIPVIANSYFQDG